MPVPLHFRIPLEYAFSMAFALPVAFLYSAFARADFVLALGVGLLLTVGVYALLYVLLKKRFRRGMVHPTTIGLLALTAAFALGVIKL